MSLSLVSLNIEGSLHLDAVGNFLKTEQADVVCLQEVMQHDIPALEALLGVSATFVPMCRLEGARRALNREEDVMGMAFFSKITPSNIEVIAYREPEHIAPLTDESRIAELYTGVRQVLLIARIEKEGQTYSLATTHFTWTPEGDPDARQREDVEKVLEILRTRGPLILTGDMNAKRGGEIYARFLERYVDAVPLSYETSIDTSIHRFGVGIDGKLAHSMVDVLFLDAGYAAEAKLIFGISDHAAVKVILSRV